MTTSLATTVPLAAPRLEPACQPTKSKKTLEPPQTLSDVISGLHEIFADDFIDVDEVQHFMESYRAKKNEWERMAAFDTHRYTRNLIDSGNGKFNLILLCWGEGHGSSIHDHSDSHCFMKIMDGSLTETKYSWPSEKKKIAMNKTDVTAYEKDQVAYINDSIGLHRVENRSHTNKAVSLHLYSPPFNMCQSFDERSGHKVKCNVTFHTKYGEKVCYKRKEEKEACCS